MNVGKKRPLCTLHDIFAKQKKEAVEQTQNAKQKKVAAEEAQKPLIDVDSAKIIEVTSSASESEVAAEGSPSLWAQKHAPIGYLDVWDSMSVKEREKVLAWTDDIEFHSP
jgi:hypothetical protein